MCCVRIASVTSSGRLIGCRINGDKNMVGISKISPSDTLNATAILALKKLATIPTAMPPTAATPIHCPSMPRAVPLISGSDDIRIIVLCIVLYLSLIHI